MHLLTVFVVSALATVAVATDFDKCDIGLAPKKLDVVGCVDQPCDFQPGKKLVMDMVFTVDHDVSKLTPDVTAYVLGLSVDYPLPQQDGCKALVGASCPLEDGESATYHLEMNIPPIHIKSGVNMTFTMTDQNTKPVSCFKMRGQVV